MAPPTAVLMSALLVMPTDPPRPPATPLPPADFLSPLSASPPAPPCPPPLCATMPKATAVAALTCRVPAGAAPITCEPWGAKQNPASGHAARWSLPVAAAARLVEGRVDLATFEAPASGPVLALARRTAWEPLAGARFPEVFEAEIVAETRDGLRHEIRVDDVYGNAGRPAGDDAVREKFRRNAARGLAPEEAASLEAAIDALAEAPRLDALTLALSPSARSDA